MEERPENPIHDSSMVFVVGAKSPGSFLAVCRIVPRTNCATLQFFVAFGKRMRLQIVDHLELVFNIPEKHIGRGEIIPVFGCDQLPADESIQRTKRAPIKERRDPLTCYDLNSLHEEFDFPDAAGTELHIAPLVAPVGHLRIDHILHAAHVAHNR